jgi:hypothetical protein
LNTKFFIGCVEDRKDPLYLGRCRVRIVSIHTDNKIELPTKDLPWAYPIAPIHSAGMNGIGSAPVGPVEGTWVLCFFNDDAYQQPFMIGSMGGVPLSQGKVTADELTKFIYQGEATAETNKTGISTGSGGVLTDSSGTPVSSGSSDSEKHLGSMSKEQTDKLKEAIGKKESGGDYTKVNSLGYLGKYQFGSSALQDLGYVKKGTSSKSSVLSEQKRIFLDHKKLKNPRWILTCESIIIE